MGVLSIYFMVKQSITPEICKLLLASPEWSQYKIIKTFAISSKTVSAIANGTYTPSRKGPKTKFTEEHIGHILELAFLNPRMSSKMLAQKFSEKFRITISDMKIREIIKENGFKYLKARKIQERSANFNKI